MHCGRYIAVLAAREGRAIKTPFRHVPTPASTFVAGAGSPLRPRMEQRPATSEARHGQRRRCGNVFTASLTLPPPEPAMAYFLLGGHAVRSLCVMCTAPAASGRRRFGAALLFSDHCGHDTSEEKPERAQLLAHCFEWIFGAPGWVRTSWYLYRQGWIFVGPNRIPAPQRDRNKDRLCPRFSCALHSAAPGFYFYDAGR